MIKSYITPVLASLPLFFGTFEKEVPEVEVHEYIESVQEVTQVIEEPVLQMEATFYTAFCNTGCIGITSSGHDVSKTIYYKGMRVIAAPKEIPLYTIYDIELQDGETFRAIVLDRGGDIRGEIIDILVSNTKYAYQKGRQTAYMKEVK